MPTFCSAMNADTFVEKHPKKVFSGVSARYLLVNMGEYHLHDHCIRRLNAFVHGHDLRNMASGAWKIEPAVGAL
jgi:hypothetical protein